MSLQRGWMRGAAVAGAFVAVWLCLRYLFPLFLPFMLGFALALAAEPFCKFFRARLRWRRAAAAFAAVSITLGLLLTALWLAGAAAVEQAAKLAGSLDGAAEQLAAGVEILRHWSAELASKAPGGLAQPLRASVEELFADSGALLHRGADAALGMAGQAAQRLPGSLVTLGTAVLAAYMLSARLPRLLERLTGWPLWRRRLGPALVRLKKALLRWLGAQLKLSAVTFGIVLGGLALLGVKQSLALAALTAAVDAVPLLGSGTVLLPWALVSFLNGAPVRAVGLLGTYLTALLTRSSLEPRLVGRQLGLDPLAALAALYAGYRIWGFGGMILAPILTVTAKELCRGDNS